MQQKEKLKLFWRIINHLNKKFCKNKLVIKDIIFLTKDELNKLKEKGREPCGIYMIEEKVIAVDKELSLVGSITNLCHELTHAYQHQIEHNHRGGHNKVGGKVYLKFMKATDKILKISV
ncbi:MAG: hypothetical protein ABIH65_01685 [Nanoarchaeota archaeon]